MFPNFTEIEDKITAKFDTINVNLDAHRRLLEDIEAKIAAQIEAIENKVNEILGFIEKSNAAIDDMAGQVNPAPFLVDPNPSDSTPLDSSTINPPTHG